MKLTIVCEHLFRLPELPCVELRQAPISKDDSGFAYHCLECVDRIGNTADGLEYVAERSKCVCDSHCDPMTVVRVYVL